MKQHRPKHLEKTKTSRTVAISTALAVASIGVIALGSSGGATVVPSEPTSSPAAQVQPSAPAPSSPAPAPTNTPPKDKPKPPTPVSIPAPADAPPEAETTLASAQELEELQNLAVELSLEEIPSETLRIVSANIKVSHPTASFLQDYRKVLDFRPDFIMGQEFAGRAQEILAVEGYSISQNLTTRYTAETPVLWDSERWALVESGSRNLTVRKVKWGERTVNYAVLQSRTTGRKVSIVSAHPAPTIKVTDGLLPIFLDGLENLVGELAVNGPVLVAGDLNVHYRGGLWGSAGFAQSPLKSTYDIFGMLPGGTGDYTGGTIDYMFWNQDPDLAPKVQGKWEQNSDHDAIWSEWELSTSVEMLPEDMGSLVLEPEARG